MTPARAAAKETMLPGEYYEQLHARKCPKCDRRGPFSVTVM